MTRVVRLSMALLAASLAVAHTAAPSIAKPSTRAQATPAVAEKLAPDQKRVVVYRCSAGDRESAKPGRCPTHKRALKKVSVVRTWKCESCGMTFNHPGICSMGDGPLVAYDVTYMCPADGKPVEHGGMCTRCDMEAKASLVKAPEAVAKK